MIQNKHTDIVHFHNTFPLISPSAYYAAKAECVPVVQTLHNYRHLCPNALFYRNNQVCEECMNHTVPWPGIFNRCYRSSLGATSIIAAMFSLHKALGTWKNMISFYIALTEFSRNKFIDAGLPPDKIVVKPNFVHPDPVYSNYKHSYALFVGRLSKEKGIITLLKSWELIGNNIPLKIVGGGSLFSETVQMSKNNSGIECLGPKDKQYVYNIMGDAAFLLFPSEWYEGLPVTILESFAKGTPIIASNMGSMAEIIDNGRTGLLFNPGDPKDLATKVEWAWTHPVTMREMGKEARREYELKYTAEVNYKMLMDIYQKAIDLKS